MKQTIPFVKDISFNSKIAEITSISLEHNLKMENDDSVVGTFIVSGKYKVNQISINEEEFKKDINFDITLDDKYDSSKVIIDIDDFYYEIINEEYLRVHIDVLIDNLTYIKKEEKPAIQEVEKETLTELKTDERLTDIKEEKLNIVKQEEQQSKIDIKDNITTNFFDEKEQYITYKIHIIRENETINSIIEKYNVSKEELEKYNSLDNIVLGTKIIIPISNGKGVIDFQYENINIQNNKITAKESDKWYLIGKDNRKTIKTGYDELIPLTQNNIVRENNSIYLIDEQGNIISEKLVLNKNEIIEKYEDETLQIINEETAKRTKYIYDKESNKFTKTK